MSRTAHLYSAPYPKLSPLSGPISRKRLAPLMAIEFHLGSFIKEKVMEDICARNSMQPRVLSAAY